MIQQKFSIIYADPPWNYYAGGNRNASRYYNCMSTEEICRLPVCDLAADDCALFLWSTMPCLPDALQVITAWGFKYCTVAFNWFKQNRKKASPFFGLGNWTRANTEICLLATKGHIKRKHNNVPQVIIEPIREHSRKPDITRKRIVELMGDLPRVELFARQHIPGWHVWGNEIASIIALEAS
jgi:site-specific DNA-methyltransferase (adenine-specific)